MTQITAFVVHLLLLCSLTQVSHAKTMTAIPHIRFSTSAEKVRIVLDLPKEATFTDQSTPLQPLVKCDFPLLHPLPSLTLNDPVASAVSLTPGEDGKSALFSVNLVKARKCNIFSLPAQDGKPFRIIIDVLKRFHHEETRTLSPAITFTRMEDQNDERYMLAHILKVDTRDPHIRLRVVPALPPRERVTAMVTRTGAVAGVNGGFFMEGTRPLQLLKVDGQVKIMPLWQRSAMAFPQNGPPVLDNPNGIWRLTLADGTKYDLADGFHVSKDKTLPATRVYDGNIYTTVIANPNGVTALICNNTVTRCSSERITLTPGSLGVYIGTEQLDTLGKALVTGTTVTCTPVLTPDWIEYPDAISAGPRLLRRGNIDIPYEAERIPADIRYGRHPRTSIGVTADGRTIIIVVEATKPYGDGATLEEMAGLMKSRGVVDAMNLDGGGSSAMAIGSETVNFPPNSWTRPVANGVLVYDSRIVPAAPPSANVQPMEVVHPVDDDQDIAK